MPPQPIKLHLPFLAANTLVRHNIFTVKVNRGTLDIVAMEGKLMLELGEFAIVVQSEWRLDLVKLARAGEEQEKDVVKAR